MCGIDLVLLLLLLIFYDTLVSYSLTLICIITAPGIPVRRNINLRPTKIIIDPIVSIETIILSPSGMARSSYMGKVMLFSITFLRPFYSILDYGT